MTTSARLHGFLAMGPAVARDVLPADLRERLAKSVDLVPTDAIADFTTPTARAALADAEILVTGWGCPLVNAEVVAAAPHLRAIFHAAGSVKSHLTEAVWDRGIVVSSAADTGAEPVVDFTVAAITLAGKRAIPLARDYAAGRPRDTSRPLGADGRRVGVLGASRIGRGVISRLVAAAYPVAVADPYLTPAAAEALGAELVDVDELCRTCDIVTLHAPNLPATRHVINARRLALLRPGAIFINTARGALVDTAALTEACAAGRIDAILDVTDPEPLPAGHPLLALPNVLVTPHLAGPVGSEVRRLGEYAIAEIERYVRGDALCGLVRREELPILA
jgi:phosphoglycerate dehydrogenase-like enzyme